MTVRLQTLGFAAAFCFFLASCGTEKQGTIEASTKNLNKSEVLSHVSGNTETWTKGGGYYSPDGQLNVLWKGEESVGQWEVSDGGEVCYVVDTWGPDEECHRYIREAGQTKLLFEGKARVAKILPGNQLNSVQP